MKSVVFLPTERLRPLSGRDFRKRLRNLNKTCLTAAIHKIYLNQSRSLKWFTTNCPNSSYFLHCKNQQRKVRKMNRNFWSSKQDTNVSNKIGKQLEISLSKMFSFFLVGLVLISWMLVYVKNCSGSNMQ